MDCTTGAVVGIGPCMGIGDAKEAKMGVCRIAAMWPGHIACDLST